MHCCTDSGSTAVFQERERTTKTRGIIVHKQPDDFVLNSSQHRNALHIGPFYTDMPHLGQVDAILQGAAAESTAKKSRVQNARVTNQQAPPHSSNEQRDLRTDILTSQLSNIGAKRRRT
jgi:hypothetical protein